MMIHSIGFHALKNAEGGRKKSETNAYIIPFLKKEFGWCVFNALMKMKAAAEKEENRKIIFEEMSAGRKGGMAKHQKKFRLL
jgi:hypothetical protein